MNIHMQNPKRVQQHMENLQAILQFQIEGGTIQIIENKAGRKRKQLTANAKTRGATSHVQFKGV